MSAELLQRIQGHLDAEGLLAGYDTLYFRWTDEQVNGNTPFILFRAAGSAGDDNYVVQYPDVRIILVANPSGAVAGDARMREIIRFFRADDGYRITGASGEVLSVAPIGPVIGPLYLENDRPIWELNVRCLVDDY